MNSQKRNQKICEDEIVSLYWEKDFSLAKIARLYDRNPVTIYRFMLKHKIERRKFHRRKYCISKEILIKLYCDERKSTLDISKKFRCSQWVISDLMKKYGLKRRNANSYHEWKEPGNLIKPKLDNSPCIAYILGVMLGDGWVYKRKNLYTIGLDSKDRVFCEKFREKLQIVNLNSCLVKLKKKEIWRTLATSKLFFTWFESLGFKEIEKIAYACPLEFIEGFYESEGCISRTVSKVYGRVRYSVIIVNTNKNLMTLMLKLLTNLGFNPTLNVRKSKPPRKPIWALCLLRQNEVSSFFNKIQPCIKKKQ